MVHASAVMCVPDSGVTCSFLVTDRRTVHNKALGHLGLDIFYIDFDMLPLNLYLLDWHTLVDQLRLA